MAQIIDVTLPPKRPNCTLKRGNDKGFMKIKKKLRMSLLFYLYPPFLGVHPKMFLLTYLIDSES